MNSKKVGGGKKKGSFIKLQYLIFQIEIEKLPQITSSKRIWQPNRYKPDKFP